MLVLVFWWWTWVPNCQGFATNQSHHVSRTRYIHYLIPSTRQKVEATKAPLSDVSAAATKPGIRYTHSELRFRIMKSAVIPLKCILQSHPLIGHGSVKASSSLSSWAPTISRCSRMRMPVCCFTASWYKSWKYMEVYGHVFKLCSSLF